MLSTPSRYLEWRVTEGDLGGIMIADARHRIVCHVRARDDAEEIVREHNKALDAREEWLHAKAS